MRPTCCVRRRLWAARHLRLRFEDPAEEDAYVEESQKDLRRISMLIHVVIPLWIIPVAALVLFREIQSQQQPFRWSLSDHRFPTLASWFLNLFWSALNLGILRFGRLVNVSQERLVVLSSILAAITMNFANVWHGPRLLGADPEAAWTSIASPSAGESLRSISLHVQLCCITVFLPVRVRFLHMHNAAMPVLYLAPSIALGSPLPFSINAQHFLFLTIAAGALSIGAHRREFHQRGRWRALRAATAANEEQQAKLDKNRVMERAMGMALSVLCDAVFQADEQFLLHGDCNKFWELLGSPGSPTTKASLQLCIKDWESFLWLVAQSTTSGLPQMLPLDFSVPSGNGVLRLDVFVMDTRLADGLRFLIGVRLPQLPVSGDADMPNDHQEYLAKSIPVPPPTSCGTMYLIEKPLVSRAHVFRESANKVDPDLEDCAAVTNSTNSKARRQWGPGDEFSSATSRSTPRSSASWRPLRLGRDRACLVVDALAPGLEIVQGSPGLVRLAAPPGHGSDFRLVGLSFCDWVDDKRGLVDWIQEAFNRIMDDEAYSSPARTETLRTPLCCETFTELRVELRLSCLPLGDWGVEVSASELPLVISISRVRSRTVCPTSI